MKKRKSMNAFGRVVILLLVLQMLVLSTGVLANDGQTFYADCSGWSFILENPTNQNLSRNWEVYLNGDLVDSGTVILLPSEVRTFDGDWNEGLVYSLPNNEAYLKVIEDDIQDYFWFGPCTGTITIAKVAEGAGDTSFSFEGDLDDFALADGERTRFEELLPGDYIVTELIPQDWELESVICLGGDSTAVTDGVTVHLDFAGEVVCTFTNMEVAPVIPPVINEFVFNHTGTDTEAFIELFGLPSTDFSGFTLLEIEGDDSGSGVIDAILPVGSTDANGFWLDDEDVENGTVTLLLVSGFTGSLSDDLDTDNDGTLDSTPWDAVHDSIAVSDGGSGDRTYATVVLSGGFDGVSYPPGGASLIPNGTDTDSVDNWMRNDYDGAGFDGFAGSPVVGEALNTPSAVNAAYVPTTGSIIIEKQTDPGDATDTFSFTGAIVGGISDDGQIGLNNVLPGEYTVQESEVEGWQLTDITCDDDNSSGNLDTRTAIFQLEAGETVKCTFTNTSVQPQSVELLLSEIIVTPTESEFVEIYNPTGAAIDLSNVYLTDATYAGGGTYYYNIVTGANAGGGGYGDFHARFPDGASINPAEYQTIALNGSTNFQSEFGITPTYELYEDDASSDAVPDMREALPGSINNQGGLTNDGEVVVLYLWDGSSDLVADLDYVVWGDKVEAVDKTGVSIDGPDADDVASVYLNDTAIESQDVVAESSHEYGYSWQRLDLTEGAEIATGGNGINGEDETSEDLSNTWCEDLPTPGVGTVCTSPLPDIIINEVDADTPGDDAQEFIELYDGGTGNTSLDGLVVVLFNGSDDQSYTPVFDLDGYSTNAEGYFVIGTVAGSDIYVSPGAYGWLQNGADAVALYVGNDTDFPNDTSVTTEGLIDAIVYDTNDGDDSGLLPLLNTGQPQINEDGGGDKDNHSNQRCPDGSGGARNTDFYAQYAPSPGAANVCGVVAEGCGDPAFLISAVQGNGSTSSLDGTSVTIEGVVVGDFQTGDYLSGFFLQEEDSDSDGDVTTSEGIFVYDGFSPAVDVIAGDVVRVTGTVDEYYDLTELTSVSSVTVCSSGNSATAASVTLPMTTLDDWEQYEGMLINIPQTLYVSGNYTQGRYGEVDLSVTDRLSNPTNVVEPGSAALALQDLNDRSRIQLEDGRTTQNPDPAPYIGIDGTLRAGDTLPSLTGVLHFAFGSYEVHPVDAVNFTRVNARDLTPPSTGGSVNVASFNVLNYFVTIDDSGAICGPLSNQDCRGADTTDEFTRQRDKIVSAITTMDADVIGLMEIENHPADAALLDLVDGLNAVAGAGTYAAVNTGPVGDDAIKVAFIYKPGVVSLVGNYAVLDSSVDPTFLDDYNRPALAQSFIEIATGESFTAVVNHLKSKGSDCDAIGDPDMDDGQGNCNLTRTSAAEALVNWLNTNPTGSGDDDFIIIGDLNSYAKEDPIDTIIAGGYTNLLEAFIGADAYSYVFAGQAGYLDHALANASLTGQVTGVTTWHINADEPAALDYNDYNQPSLYAADPFRASDHDPVIVGLSLTSKNPSPTDNPILIYLPIILNQ